MRYVISVPDFSSTSMYFREGWKADSNICGGTLDQKILWVGPVATFRWDHAMTASSSPSWAAATAAATNTAAMGEQHIRESIARTPLPPSPPTPPLFNNLHEYFKPVFDEVDKVNKMYVSPTWRNLFLEYILTFQVCEGGQENDLYFVINYL